MIYTARWRVGRRGWAVGLGTGGPEVWESGLARLGKRAAGVRALLAALAWARGGGLPDAVWVPVARSLLAGGPDEVVTELDARWLPRAAPSLVRGGAGPGGGVVRRLSDAGLAGYLRGGPSRPPGGHDDPGVAYRVECERRVTAALLGTVPAGPAGRDWLSADPYVLVHLAEHAAVSGDPQTLVRLLGDGGFLAVADPVTLMPLMDVTDPALRETARVYRRARPLLGGDPAANAAGLAETASALDAKLPALSAWTADPAGGGPPPLYRTWLVSAVADDSLLALSGHTGIVNDVSCWADDWGRPMLASAGDDETIRLWNPRTGEAVGEPLTASTGWVAAVASGVTQDGRPLLASCGDEPVVRLWDPLTGLPTGPPLAGHSDIVYWVTFGTAPDGRLLLASGGRDQTVRLWDPLTCAPLGESLVGHRGAVNEVAFGTMEGDGEAGGGRLILASASADHTIRLWDPLTGAALGEPLTGHTDSVYTVAFGTLRGDGEAGGGRLILASASRDTTIRLWEPLTGTPLGEPFGGDGGRVYELAFGPGWDGQLLLASTAQDDSTIRLWDPLTGAPAAPPLTAPDAQNSVAFLPGRDGRPLLASTGNDGTVRLWDPAPRPRPTTRPAEHSRWVDAVAFHTSPGMPPLLVSVDGYRAVRVWDPQTWTPAGEPMTGHTEQVDAVAVTAAGGRPLVATGSSDKTVRLWNPLTGTPVGDPLTGHTAPVRCVAFGAVKGDGEVGGGRLLLASAGDDHTVRLWDPATSTALGSPLGGHTDAVDAVTLGAAPDGTPLLASASADHTIRLWNPLTGQPIGGPLTGHTGPVRAVTFLNSATGAPLLASASDDTTIRLWDPLTGIPLGPPLTGHTSWICALTCCATPDGVPVLASAGGDKTIRVWDPATRICRLTLHRGSPIRCLAATGLTLAIGHDNGLTVIELDAPSLSVN